MKWSWSEARAKGQRIADRVPSLHGERVGRLAIIAATLFLTVTTTGQYSESHAEASPRAVSTLALVNR